MYESPLQVNDSSTLLRAAWRFRVGVLAAILLGLVLGLVIASLRPNDTTASTTLVLRDANSVDRSLPNENENGAYQRFVQSQAILATSPEALTRVAERTGLALDDVEDRVTANHVAAADGLRMAATGSSEGDATRLLDAFVTTFRELRLEAVASQRDTIAAVLGEDEVEDEFVLEQAIYADGVAFSDTVELQSTGVLFRIGLPAIAFALVAGAAAFVAAGVADDRNPILWGVHDIQARYDLPVRGLLTAVPGERAVAYEQFAVELEQDLVAPLPSTPMVTILGAGTTSREAREVVTGVCAALADIGLNVAVFGNERAGAVDQVVYRAAATDSSVTSMGFIGDLLDFVSTSDFSEALERARVAADIVIVDSPPLRSDATAIRVAGRSDATILIVPDDALVADVTNTTEVLDGPGVDVQGMLVLTESRAGSPFAARPFENPESDEPVADLPEREDAIDFAADQPASDEPVADDAVTDR